MNWTRAVAGAAMLAIVGWLATATVFTQGGDASAQLRAAMHRETVQGDLNGAIVEYRRIADTSSNRAAGAQALLRLGAAYEKLGRPEARQAYERVLRTYADQPKAVAVARARLAKVGGTTIMKKAQAEITPRRLFDGLDSLIADMTADGRFAVGGGYHEVILRDLSSGKVITVLAPTLTGRLSTPRISDDGRQVVYTEVNSEANVSVLSLIGTEPDARARTLVSQPRTRFTAADWSPDGKFVLTAVARYASDSGDEEPATLDLAMVDVASGTLKVVTRFENWQSEAFLTHARFSPDGRYIAHVRRPSQGSSDRHLEVIDLLGGTTTTLVGTAEMRQFPVWSHDGGMLFYLEGPIGRQALWSVPVQEGRAAGAPIRLHGDVHSGPLGVTPAGSLVWSQGAKRQLGDNYVYVSERHSGAGSDLDVFQGVGPAWSSDGSFLASMRRGSDGPRLIVRDVRTGQERSFGVAGEMISTTPTWIADDSAMVVEAAGDKAKLLRLDLRTGTSRPLLPEGKDIGNVGRGVVSPDGRTAYLPRANDTGTALADIVAVDTATGQARVVTAIEGRTGRGAFGGVNVGIALSPDGRTLAVMTYTKAYETAQLFTIGVDGQGRQDVVPAVGVGPFGPSGRVQWSRDGRSLVYVDFDARQHWRIMRVPAVGGNPEPDGIDFDTVESLLQGQRLAPGSFKGFSVSPDGTRIAFGTERLVKGEVWALDVIALLAQSRE